MHSSIVYQQSGLAQCIHLVGGLELLIDAENGDGSARMLNGCICRLLLHGSVVSQFQHPTVLPECCATGVTTLQAFLSQIGGQPFTIGSLIEYLLMFLHERQLSCLSATVIHRFLATSLYIRVSQMVLLSMVSSCFWCSCIPAGLQCTISARLGRLDTKGVDWKWDSVLGKEMHAAFAFINAFLRVLT